MSVDFQHTVEIEQPCERVFAFVSDFANNPKWQGGMVACEWTSPEIRAVGATYVQHAKFLGRRIDTHFEVTAFEPGRSISIASTVSTFPIQVTRTVVPTSDGRGAQVTAHIRGQPRGVLKLLSGMVKKSVMRDYRALKALLESER